MGAGSLVRLRSQLLLFVVYLTTAKLGLLLDPVGGFATLVWPPTGIALGSLARFGTRLWPAVSAGAFVANVWSGAPVLVAAGIALGNTLEAILGARILRRAHPETGPLVRLRHAFGLLIAALASPLVSAGLGVLSLWLGGVIETPNVLEASRAWWLGDVLGALVVAPLILEWSGGALLVGSGKRRWEVLLLGCVGVATALLAFSGEASAALQRPHLIFPVLIWAALRLGACVSACTVLVICAVGIVLTAHGLGPFTGATLHESLTALQGFIGNAAVTSLFLATASAERARALDSLAAEGRALEHALGVRDEFLSIASHELRTPLAALTLQVDALESGLREREQQREPRASLEPEVRRAGRAVAQVERLTRVVEQLLDVSRMAAGRLQLRPEPFDFSELTREVVQGMAEPAARAGCSVKFETQGPLPGSWDRFRIEQVITNLLANAFKYGAKQPVEVILQKDGETAVLRVVDHGIGIPPEARERIFERFERVATGHQRTSLGIGLYIARQVMEAHAGSIRVESTLGAGSTFIVELPLIA